MRKGYQGPITAPTASSAPITAPTASSARGSANLPGSRGGGVGGGVGGGSDSRAAGARSTCCGDSGEGYAEGGGADGGICHGISGVGRGGGGEGSGSGGWKGGNGFGCDGKEGSSAFTSAWRKALWAAHTGSGISTSLARAFQRSALLGCSSARRLSSSRSIHRKRLERARQRGERGLSKDALER